MRAALRRFFRRLVNGLRPGQGEGDVARELASHLTLLEDECRRRGMPADEARRAARLALGGVDQAKELHRDARAFAWIDDAVRDLRYVVRTLRNNVGFTMAVVVTIAVAISGLDAPAKAEMYVPYPQFSLQPWFAPRDLVVRTAGDPMALVGSITHEIHAVDPNLPVTHIRLATDILDEEVAARRVGTIVLVAFAAFSVLLAVVGIYGVISYFVVQHIPEIGVRIALGAQTRDILALVAGKGVTLTLVGVGIGCMAAVAATRLVSSLLYGFTGFDPTAIVFASVLLVLLALVASYVPARRATRLDPVEALRYR